MQKHVSIDENVMFLSDLLIVKADVGKKNNWMEHKWPIFAMESNYSSWNWLLIADFIPGLAFIFVFLEAW